METTTKPIILEDLHVAPATQAANDEFEVLANPSAALKAVRAGTSGIFDIFQPRTDDGELNKLLERYLDQAMKEGVGELMIMTRCSEDYARQTCGAMAQMLKTADQLPYGAAIAYEAAKKHRPWVVCSDLHRHSIDYAKTANPEYQFNGWVLLSPFGKYLTEEEFACWDGQHLATGPSTGLVDKSSVETWKRAIEKFKAQSLR